MGSHYRSGHWRTSKSGNVHWVSGHSVDRDSGGGGGLPPSWSSRPVKPLRPVKPPKPARLKRAKSPTNGSGRRASRVEWHTRTLAQPNATCPVCGAAVYFYGNAAGSKVYFDELGPPWPKHPCTDRTAAASWAAAAVSASWHQTSTSISRVPDSSVPWTAGPSQRQTYPQGRPGIEEWRIKDLWYVGSACRLRMQRVDGSNRWGVWSAQSAVNVSVGDPVFLAGRFDRRATLSFVDRRDLVVRHILVTRLSASWSELWQSWRKRH